MNIEFLIEELKKHSASAKTSDILVLIPGEEPYEIKEVVSESGMVFIVLATE